MEVLPVTRPREDEFGRRAAIALIIAVTVVRLVYQFWLTPWELVGDEAYYWVQGQHLDWCYNEKGALFPWLIRLCCEVFGNTQFAVRLPVLLGSAAGAWLLVDLTRRVAPAGGRGGAGLIAAALFFLTPAMQANAQISTQDGLLIPWTLGMTTIGLCLIRRWMAGKNTWAHSLAWWALLGVGMHLRFSAPLLLTAPACFVLLQRKRLRLSGAFLLQQAAGIVLFAILLLPIVLWNARNGWPTFEHVAGHLGMGGDQQDHVSKGNVLAWTSSLIGGVIGAYGPVLVLALWASWQSIRTRGEQQPDTRADQLWLLCATWPSVAFFVALSFTKPVLASWPLPSIVPALALAGIYIKQQSLFGRSRNRWFRPVWTAAVAYGVCGAILLMFPTWLRYLPLAGKRLDDKVVKRIAGHAELAARVQDARRQYGSDGTGIVATYYDTASLLWFYLPDHPAVHVASHRPSTYDHWADTRLDSAALAGRQMLLVGKADTPWPSLLQFGRIDPTADASLQLGREFGGRLLPQTALARSGSKGME